MTRRAAIDSMRGNGAERWVNRKVGNRKGCVAADITGIPGRNRVKERSSDEQEPSTEDKANAKTLSEPSGTVKQDQPPGSHQEGTQSVLEPTSRPKAGRKQSNQRGGGGFKRDARGMV